MIDTVALPIELQVNGVDGMLCMQSISAADGTYQLIVTFKIGMDPDTAQVLVQNRVSNALASLPLPAQVQGVSIKKKVVAWLKMLENRMAHMPSDDPMATYETRWLWEELGVVDRRR